jgi:hypothetical protein
VILRGLSSLVADCSKRHYFEYAKAEQPPEARRPDGDAHDLMPRARIIDVLLDVT